MPIFRVKSVKIYTGQKKFTRTPSARPWQISGMIINTTGIASSDFSTGARIQETDIGQISKSSQFQAKINPG